MSTTSANLSLTLAEGPDVVNVANHIANNFNTLDSKWSTPGNPELVQVGSAGTPGSSTVVARSNHVHGLSTATPSSTGTTNQAGSNTTVAASDHIHANGTNSVPTAAIQDSAVTTAKINDSAVTTAKINDSAVTTAKINDLAVTTAKINDDAVTAAKIATGAVGSSELASGAVVAHLGYTPVNKAGDTMTADLSFSSGQGVHLGTTASAGRLYDVAGTTTVMRCDSSHMFSVYTNNLLAEIFAVQWPSTIRFMGNTVWHAGNDGAGSGLDADTLDGLSSAAFATSGHNHDASYAALSQAVPNGAVVFFETLAELTAAGASWTRYSAGDGRLLVGSGSSASGQSFTQATDYGSTWTPAASVGLSNSLGISDTVTWTAGTIAASSTPAVGMTAGTNFNPASFAHTHAAPTMTKGGSITLSGSLSLTGTSTVWLPYMRAGVWGKKI